MEPSISQRRLCTFATLSSAKAPAKCYDPNDHERVVVAWPIRLFVEWKQRRT